MNTKKKWFFSTFIITIFILLMLAGMMIVIDPYFHYHKPIEGISYRMYSERYMNDGIAKHFDYSAVISGSSMNQNFKTSLMDELWNTKTIKITFSGAGFEEIAKGIDTALSSGNSVDYVLWGIDYLGLDREYDWQGYEEYPTYLYDNNIWNDSSYIWNKTLLFEGAVADVMQTLKEEPSTSFDEYSSWNVEGGWSSIQRTYFRSEEIMPMQDGMDEKTIERVKKNVSENIVKLVKKHPNTTFLLFYTPYSALYWESIVRNGTFLKQLEIERMTTEMLLDCENIKLYSFNKHTDITTNVNNYRDKEHYLDFVNDLIMHWIKENDGMITKENYLDLIAWEKEFYMSFDYDILYKDFVKQ